MYFTYVIQSLKTRNFYIGSTSNLKRRIVYHNNSWSRATKNRGPWKLVYSEKFEQKETAIKREYQIKSWKSGKLIERLVDRGPVV